MKKIGKKTRFGLFKKELLIESEDLDHLLKVLNGCKEVALSDESYNIIVLEDEE